MFDARTQNDPVSQKLFQIEPMPGHRMIYIQLFSGYQQAEILIGANRHAAKMTAKCEEVRMFVV